MSLLLSYRADVNASGEHGRTPLHWCVELLPVRNGQRSKGELTELPTATIIFGVLSSSAPVVSIFLTSATRHLLSAARSGKENVIPLLISGGAAVDARDHTLWCAHCTQLAFS